MARQSLTGTLWILGAAALLIWAGAAGANPPGSSGDRAPTAEQRDLAERVREVGAVRVIVTLNVPFVPEGELKSTWQVFQQRNRIAQAQDRVLERLKALGCDSVGTAKRFETVPQMALRADGVSLEALWGDPDVKDVQGDSLSAPH